MVFLFLAGVLDGRDTCFCLPPGRLTSYRGRPPTIALFVKGSVGPPRATGTRPLPLRRVFVLPARAESFPLRFGLGHRVHDARSERYDGSTGGEASPGLDPSPTRSDAGSTNRTVTGPDLRAHARSCRLRFAACCRLRCGDTS